MSAWFGRCPRSRTTLLKRLSDGRKRLAQGRHSRAGAYALGMKHAAELQAILSADTLRCHALDLVHSLGLPDCWIGAGFIRNAVWDNLHGKVAFRPIGDVDVLWFDRERTDASEDRKLEATLCAMASSIDWSVKNQARMHRRNDDPPYASVIDAMRRWPETATAVAARQARSAGYEIAAPFGLEDLFTLVLRPTPRFTGEKYLIFRDRVRTKRWLETWPLLRVQDSCDGAGFYQPTRMRI
jgi:uncharacterized protein